MKIILENGINPRKPKASVKNPGVIKIIIPLKVNSLILMKRKNNSGCKNKNYHTIC